MRSLVDSPEHNAAVALGLDVVDLGHVHGHTFPLSTSSLTTWFETHYNFVSGHVFLEESKDGLVSGCGEATRSTKVSWRYVIHHDVDHVHGFRQGSSEPLELLGNGKSFTIALVNFPTSWASGGIIEAVEPGCINHHLVNMSRCIKSLSELLQH